MYQCNLKSLYNNYMEATNKFSLFIYTNLKKFYLRKLGNNIQKVMIINSNVH